LITVCPDFLVGGDAEGRVLGGQTAKGDAHLFHVGLGLRLDRDLDHRFGNSMRSRITDPR
jgi:hypothetical protein